MNITEFLDDAYKIAEICGTVLAGLGALNLIQTRLARRDTNEMRRVIGEPDPIKARLTEGTTLTEKVERLSDGIEALTTSFKFHVDKERSREIAREVAELPGTGRRVRYDYQGDDERGTGTQENLE